ncbi:hypothetical protein [Pseudomonas sp. NPDC089401]|uniref:hypothetical protein n=1 Tax=Pseudomonas sp. NPDC089401 TaxID=3364462 RepID=UPI0038134166
MGYCLAWVLKVVLAIPPLLVYLVFCYLAMRADNLSLVGIFRHMVLVTGLLPLCSWMVVIFKGRRNTYFRLALFAILITAYHVFLFAVSAHRDGVEYWGVQMLEFGMFGWMVKSAFRANNVAFR